MAKIGPYPKARRASRLWYNTVIFAFCSGRKGKRPLDAGKCNRTAAFAVTPRILDGNPWFRVTPSFFRLCPFSLDAPKHQDRRKAASLRNGETPRLCPSETLNTNVFARFRSQIVSWRPIVPNGGCAQSQSFPLPKLSRAVLIVGPKLFIEPGTKAIYPAFERERPRIVNNFAVERVARLRIAVLFREMNSTRLSNLAMRLE